MERSIKPEVLQLQLANTLILDVRRQNDYEASTEIVPGSTWKNPEQISAWISDVPRDQEVVIYCVRGGSVSNSVLDQLQAMGVKARFIEGGIEGWKSTGAKVINK